MQIDIFLHLQLFLFANVLPFTFHTNASSSHQRCSLKKGVLRNFSKFTGKQLRHGLFLNKLAGLRLATLLKKSLWYKCFPVNFAKFLRKPFLQNTSSGQLLLKCQWPSHSNFHCCFFVQFHGFHSYMFSIIKQGFFNFFMTEYPIIQKLVH